MASPTISRICKELASIVKSNLDPLVLVVLALFLYLSFMSRSFDEWDSYNFAFALSNYDITRDRPHPPGYPLYVFLGRLALYLVKDPLVSLTMVSAVSGALATAPVYKLTRRMYDRPTAVMTSLAIMFTPAFWLASESALTDTLFTFLLVTSVLLLYSGIKGSEKMLQLSWFVYGFAIGARPTPASLTFLFLWIPCTIFVSRKIGSKTITIKAGLLFLLSVSIWFVPMVSLLGWDSYWHAMNRQLIESSATESVWGRTLGLDPVGRLGHVVMQILAFSLGGAFMGADPLFASTNPSVFLHGAFLILAIIACLISSRSIVGRLFLFPWIVPYFVFAYSFGTLNYPRYYLPVIPAIVIPMVASVFAVTRRIFKHRPARSVSRSRNLLRFSFPAILVASFFINTLPLAVIIHNQPAPTKQLFDYVTANYRPGTTIIEFHEHRVFQFYQSEVRYLHVLFDHDKVMHELSNFSPENAPLITMSAYLYLASHPAIAELRVNMVLEFFRDPHVKVEDHRVRLYRIVSVSLR